MGYPRREYRLQSSCGGYAQHIVDVTSAKSFSIREGNSFSAHSTRRVSTLGSHDVLFSRNARGKVTGLAHQDIKPASLSEPLSIKV